ncbi:MAG: nuclear transport factor 2 family protein [Solirubrobacterales bacterium]
MAGKNLEIVRRQADAFASRDKDTWSEFAAPDVEAVPVGDWPEAEIRGRDAVWDFLVATDEPWEPGRYEFTEGVEDDEHLVARQRRHLRGKSSGVEVDYDYWTAFTFRDGMARRVQWFSTREEALAAMGLPASQGR